MHVSCVCVCVPLAELSAVEPAPSAHTRAPRGRPRARGHTLFFLLRKYSRIEKNHITLVQRGMLSTQRQSPLFLCVSPNGDTRAPRAPDGHRHTRDSATRRASPPRDDGVSWTYIYAIRLLCTLARGTDSPTWIPPHTRHRPHDRSRRARGARATPVAARGVAAPPATRGRATAYNGAAQGDQPFFARVL